MSEQTLGGVGSAGISRISWFFGILLVATSINFIYWGLNYTGMNYVLLFILAAIFGLFMAFNIGGNDVANSFGTSVGAGTLTITQALAIAAIFEVSGAIIAGGEVTKTIRKGIVDLSIVDIQPLQFVSIMMAALLSAAFWLLFATKRGWPVSTTHSIIGGIVGASMTLGLSMGTGQTLALVQWNKIGQIAISWVLSPLLGAALSYMIFYHIKKHIIGYNEKVTAKLDELKQRKKELKEEHKKAFECLTELQQVAYSTAMERDAKTVKDPSHQKEDLESDYYRELYEVEVKKTKLNARRALEQWVPLIAAVGAMVISAMLIFKGLKHIGLELSVLHSSMIVGMAGAVIWMSTFIFAKTLKNKDLSRSTFMVFSWMQLFTAAGFAFSHGSNDIANAIGPFAAILEVLRSNAMTTQVPIPSIAMISFGIVLIAGLWFIGKEVIQTVGTSLAEMHPSSGFTAELAAAAVVMLASLMGLPVSSTHILVGAVLGIGLVNRNANWKIMKPIAMAWGITLPAAGIISALAFTLLTMLL